MAMEVKIVDNSKVVVASMKQAVQLALEAIGLEAETDVMMKAPKDTGRLAASITHRVQGDKSVAIGTNVEYAIYQEFGTSKMDAANGGSGYLRPAINNNLDKYKRLAEQILKSVSI